MLNKLEDLLPRTAVRLRNCPAAVQLMALRAAWREFCDRSDAWREDEVMDLVADQFAYTLPITWDAECRRVVAAFVRTAADVAAGRDGEQLDPSGYKMKDNGATAIITFDLAPASVAVVGGLLVRVALVPYADSIEPLPADRLNYGGAALVSGALAHLYQQKGKAWFDANLFEAESERFTRAIVQASRDADAQGKLGPICYRPPEFF